VGDLSAKSQKSICITLRMQRLQENLPRSWHIEIPSVRSAIWFSLAASPAIYADGAEVLGADIGLLPASATLWQHSVGPIQWGSMSLPTEAMAQLSIASIGRDLTPSCSAVAMRPPSAALERLRRLHEAAARLAETAPEIIADPNAARGIEQALIDTMFACLAQGEVQEDVVSRRRHSAIVRRLHALAADHPGEPLYLTEVCSAIGVNQRTLTLCCQEQLGISPKRFLVLRRMHLARRALVAATAQTTTVTDIATRYGFWELGRFAVAYKATFGESPSATLHRPHDREPASSPVAVAVSA
jgi:AraC-like DNA-binding protein